MLILYLYLWSKLLLSNYKVYNIHDTASVWGISWPEHTKPHAINLILVQTDSAKINIFQRCLLDGMVKVAYFESFGLCQCIQKKSENAVQLAFRGCIQKAPFSLEFYEYCPRTLEGLYFKHNCLCVKVIKLQCLPSIQP
jgi:hypothetical protein